MRTAAIVLLHYPVRDRAGGIITTAITNLDLHDISRSTRTYGLSAMFAVHPIAAQRELAEKVRDHWLTGSGSRRIPDRTPAMEVLRVVPSIDDVYAHFGGRSSVELWTTSARVRDDSLSYEAGRARMASDGPPVILMFGTGWGIDPQLEQQADVRLEPICAHRDTGFNHLSVRAACAITLDRLLGAR
ncbi:MAG: RNA methyltransferase [Deltaproteobacteria bacterium]|nr:RNA methyltransferase [Deltaproteobacteria bacterium]